VRFYSQGRDDPRDIPKDGSTLREVGYSARFSWSAPTQVNTNMPFSPEFPAQTYGLPPIDPRGTWRGFKNGWGNAQFPGACPFNFTYYVSAVDENGKRDGTPDSLPFYVSGAPSIDSVYAPMVLVLVPKCQQGLDAAFCPQTAGITFGPDTVLVTGTYVDVPRPPGCMYTMGCEPGENRFKLPLVLWGHDHPRDRDPLLNYTPGAVGRIRSWFYDFQCLLPGCEDQFPPPGEGRWRDDRPLPSDPPNTQIFDDSLVITAVLDTVRVGALWKEILEPTVLGPQRFTAQGRDTDAGGQLCSEPSDLGRSPAVFPRDVSQEGRVTQQIQRQIILRQLQDVRPYAPPTCRGGPQASSGSQGMVATMNRTRFGAVLGAAIWLIAVVAGCNDNDLGLEKRRPNQPPQTILSSGPPDSTTGANYRVHLYWAGSDADGTIDHFDYIMIDHPAADDDIDPADPNAPNRVVVPNIRRDDPRWSSTFANDTLVVTRADTLRHRPPVPMFPVTTSSCGARTSSAGIRSSCAPSTTRACSTTHRNTARSIRRPWRRSFFLKPPVSPTVDFSGPTTIVFNWDGSDEVGDGTTLAPIASRWTYLPTRLDQEGNYIGYPDTFYTLPRSAWSPWRQWDARDKSGVQAIIRNLIPVQAGGGYYMFAVQAMDEAGAVTPVFDAHTAGKNNVVKIFVNDAVGATLVVNERFLGSFNFVGSRAEPIVLPIAAGQPINFNWRGDASSYGGEIVAYRYGWNIRNPSNDEEWQQNWCATCRTAPTRIFNSGAQRFFLETRDNAETITHAEFELVVYQVTKNRDLLFIDDTSYPPDAPEENFEDRRWSAVVDSLLARRPFQYDRAIDSYDVEANRRVAPPLPLVFDYKSIIWASRAYTTENALKRIAFFIDPFDTRRTTQTVLFNYLNVYIDNGGEFFLSGDEVSSILWPFAARNPFPANITNWDDPVSTAAPRVATRSERSASCGRWVPKPLTRAPVRALGSRVANP
jgi:hypothetical protein